MRIQCSDITLASASLAVETHSVRETLNAWVGERPPAHSGPQDRVTLVRQAPPPKPAEKAEQAAAADGLDGEQGIDPRLRVILLILEKLTGYRVKLLALGDLEPQSPPPDLLDPKRAASQQPSAGFGVEYDYHESHYELEHSEFSAAGVVRTADGREISFELGLTMHREQASETNVSLRLGDAVKKDPLVVNFAGTAAQLSDQTFRFDLDSDGATDELSFVGPGSGFLVLDKNANGTVDNGSELFGPATGSGFSELAAYDQDANGWIDEADPVYDSLRVWTKDAQGADSLTALRAGGIGAIHLGSVATPFSLEGGNGGEILSSGLYLNENGTAGTIQQINVFA